MVSWICMHLVHGHAHGSWPRRETVYREGRINSAPCTAIALRSIHLVQDFIIAMIGETEDLNSPRFLSFPALVDSLFAFPSIYYLLPPFSWQSFSQGDLGEDETKNDQKSSEDRQKVSFSVLKSHRVSLLLQRVTRMGFFSKAPKTPSVQ